MADRDFSRLTRDEFQAIVGERRAARMSRIDSMSPGLRHLVNEYGFHVVDSFLQCGVTKVRHIRHLVEVVLDEFSPTRGSRSSQGSREAAKGLGGAFRKDNAHEHD